MLNLLRVNSRLIEQRSEAPLIQSAPLVTLLRASHKSVSPKCSLESRSIHVQASLSAVPESHGMPGKIDRCLSPIRDQFANSSKNGLVGSEGILEEKRVLENPLASLMPRQAQNEFQQSSRLEQSGGCSLRTVQVSVLKARHLPRSPLGLTSCFCTVALSLQEHRTRMVHAHLTDPEWEADGSFNFRVFDRAQMLKIKIFVAWHPDIRAAELGCASMPVSEILELQGKSFERSFVLTDGRKVVRGKFGVPSVTLRFCTAESAWTSNSAENRDICGYESARELCNIQYLAATLRLQASARRLLTPVLKLSANPQMEEREVGRSARQATQEAERGAISKSHVLVIGCHVSVLELLKHRFGNRSAAISASMGDVIETIAQMATTNEFAGAVQVSPPASIDESPTSQAVKPPEGAKATDNVTGFSQPVQADSNAEADGSLSKCFAEGDMCATISSETRCFLDSERKNTVAQGGAALRSDLACDDVWPAHSGLAQPKPVTIQEGSKMGNDEGQLRRFHNDDPPDESSLPVIIDSLPSPPSSPVITIRGPDSRHYVARAARRSRSRVLIHSPWNSSGRFNQATDVIGTGRFETQNFVRGELPNSKLGPAASGPSSRLGQVLLGAYKAVRVLDRYAKMLSGRGGRKRSMLLLGQSGEKAHFEDNGHSEVRVGKILFVQRCCNWPLLNVKLQCGVV